MLLKPNLRCSILARYLIFLGIFVKRTANSMFLNQQKYTEELLHRANMSTCKPISTPANTNSKLSATDGCTLFNPTLYRSLAGALHYVTFKRPDIAYAVQQICLFVHSPRDSHFNALKRILRYLKGTIDLGLHVYPSRSHN